MYPLKMVETMMKTRPNLPGGSKATYNVNMTVKSRLMNPLLGGPPGAAWMRSLNGLQSPKEVIKYT